jgi:hypothetical protein
VKRILFSLALALSLPSGFAQDLTVAGGADCGKWLAAPRSGHPGQTWVLGYLTGMNELWTMQVRAGEREGIDNPLGRLRSPEQAISWVDDFCRTSPLGNPGDGARSLFYELTKRGKAK